MKNLQQFLREQGIVFETEKKSIRWFKSLKPTFLVRVGNSYFLDEKEAEELLDKYMKKQLQIRKRRSTQAKINLKKKTLNSQMD